MPELETPHLNARVFNWASLKVEGILSAMHVDFVEYCRYEYTFESRNANATRGCDFCARLPESCRRKDCSSAPELQQQLIKKDANSTCSSNAVIVKLLLVIQEEGLVFPRMQKIQPRHFGKLRLIESHEMASIEFVICFARNSSLNCRIFLTVRIITSIWLHQETSQWLRRLHTLVALTIRRTLSRIELLDTELLREIFLMGLNFDFPKVFPLIGYMFSCRGFLRSIVIEVFGPYWDIFGPVQTWLIHSMAPAIIAKKHGITKTK